jgi:hypothetical protein
MPSAPQGAITSHPEIRPVVSTLVNTTTIPFHFLPQFTSLFFFEMARSDIVLDSVLDAVGNTPLIRLDRIAKHEGLRCNLRKFVRTPSCRVVSQARAVGKLEYTSAGGSVKDRIAKRMIEIAEQEGKLIPGQSVVIEPTSGNTGTFCYSNSILAFNSHAMI